MSDNWYLTAMTAIVENGDLYDWKLSSFLLIIFIFLQILFPFYAYVNRVNRERDKNTLVFPLIDHFYGVMKKTHATFYFVYVVGFFCWLKLEQIPKKMGLTLITVFVLIMVCLLCLYALMLFTQVFQFLLTIMAVQKFLLYFFPSSQKYIILSRKNMQYFIRYAYYSLFFKEAIIFVLFWVSFIKEELGDNVTIWQSVKQSELVFFVFMNITFFTSALLYIPIFISVRKMSNLRSVQESKPQIYIFWQTMTALIVKMIHTSYFLFIYYDNLVEMVLPTRVLDIFSIPVIIQISYLTCNRQNVITLFASFKGRKLIRELLTPEVTTRTLVFPLIDHFYGVMKKTHATFYFIYVVGFFWWYKVEEIETNMRLTLVIMVGIIIVCILCMYALMIFTQVFQFFLTIMAVQKCLLYFYPSSQKYIILSRKNMQYFIRYAYYSLFFKESIVFVLFLVSFIKEELTMSENVSIWQSVELFELIFFVTMNTSFFLSALSYIPIFISVRKMSHLRSFQESKPQIYIFWQTMTALTMKVIHTSYFLFMYNDYLAEMVLNTRFLDVFSVPAIIQISYLTCNRQNVITLFATFKGRKLIKELITPEVTTAVSPEPRRHMI